MQKIQHLLKSKYFQNFILLIILLNAIKFGLETSSYFKTETPFSIFSLLDEFFLLVFLIEICLRILTYRIHFFKSGWNIFDLCLVVISIVLESSMFSIFRMFRVILILRLLSSIPKMRFIAQALLKTLPSMFSVAIILIVIYYCYAVITTHLYGADFPQWFGSIDESFYSLFQIMTFESWSMGIVRPIMEKHPNAWIVFVSFLLIASYIMLNIVIGIIVDCIGDIKDSQNRQRELDLSAKITHLEQQIIELKQLIITQRENK